MSNKRNNSHKIWFRAGFTLIETILGLILIAIVISLLQWGTQLLRYQSQYEINQELTWHIILQEFEDATRPIVVVLVGDKGIAFRDSRGKILSVAVHDHTLLLYINGHGFQPLLYQVASIKSEIVKHRAQITLTLCNGRRFQNRLMLPITIKDG